MIFKFMAVFFGTILASLSLVTGLAWNSAMESYLNSHPEFKSKGKWIYASLVTLFTVFYIMVFSYVIQKSGVGESYKTITQLIPN
jgi:hypothetical protein